MSKPQKQKAREREVQRVQELRRSSATSPRPSGNEYKRRPKHRGREWDI